MSYILAILGLSLLIVVHEAGHMFVARLFGMRVNTFSIGFGPRLLRYRGTRTTYQIALIPLGGYVQIAGMNPHDEVPEDDPGSYANKSSFARIATILAGPATNYLTAMVMMVILLLAWGYPRTERSTGVGEVLKDSPAARAGLKADDRITTIDGEAVENFEQVVARIQASEGRPIAITVLREGERVPLKVTPRKQGDGYKIGYAPELGISFSEVGVGQAFALGAYYPFHISGRALEALGVTLKALLSGEAGKAQVGGPVEIVHQLSRSFKESLAAALVFLAMLSAYLGLFNLLPVPALDGGRLLFLVATVVGRRQINQRLESMVHTVGFFLLVGVLLLVTYCDVARRVGGP